MAEVELENTVINFKLDTRAEVTIESARYVPVNMQLSATKKRVFGPEKEKVLVKGKFVTTLKRGILSRVQTACIIDNMTEPLLGRRKIENLNMIKKKKKKSEKLKAKKSMKQK